LTTSEEILIVKALVELSPPLVTLREKLYVPGPVVTPLTVAVNTVVAKERSVRSEVPGGSVPPTTSHVYDPVPPVAENACSRNPTLKVPRLDP
jgi:hypothetical protein